MFVASACAYAVAATLVAAGVSHLRNLVELKLALADQRLAHARIVPALATAIAVLETGTGALTLGALLEPARAPGGVRSAFLVATLIFAAFSCYLAMLLRLRPGAPCGCSHRGVPASAATLLRTGFLAAAAGMTTAFPAAVLALNLLSARTIIAFAAGLALASAAWVLPDAVQEPVPAAARPR